MVGPCKLLGALDKLDAVAALAEQALQEPDSWTALAGFLEHTTELLSAKRDRGRS